MGKPPKGAFDSLASWLLRGGRPSRPKFWSWDVMRRMDWKRFEDLCAAYYPIAGIRSSNLRLGETGGIDVSLYQDAGAPERATAIARCKSSTIHHRVGREAMAELVDSMARQDVEKGFYLSREGFDEAATALAAAHGVTLVDGQVFLHLVQRLPEQAQARLLAFATEGEWTTPTCPVCALRMERRSKDGKDYWRCPNAESCGQRWRVLQGEA